MANVQRLRILAESLLDLEWSESSHTAYLARVAKKKTTTYRELAAVIHRQLPRVPSRTQLVHLLSQLALLRKGISWNRVEKAYVKSRQSVQPTGTMRPAHLPAMPRHIAALPNCAAAAELFGLPPSVLQWLSATYPQHYVVKLISKRGKGSARVRILEQPKQRLKAAQRILLSDILRHVPAHPAAHGFVRGRSVISAAEPHVGQAVVVRMDLANFFPSIRGPRVAAVFRSLGYPYAVAKLLTDLCLTATNLSTIAGLETLEPNERINLENLYFVPHLPQGAPTSPALANLVAWRLDARLSGLARAAGCEYTRYADDLVFSGDQRFQRRVRSLIPQVIAIALAEGFRIQERKTRIMRPGCRQSALGIVLNRRLNVPREQFDQLQAILTNCARHGPSSQNRAGHADFRAHLLGRLQWLKHLNPGRAAKLEQIYRQIEW